MALRMTPERLEELLVLLERAALGTDPNDKGVSETEERERWFELLRTRYLVRDTILEEISRRDRRHDVRDVSVLAVIALVFMYLMVRIFGACE